MSKSVIFLITLFVFLKLSTSLICKNCDVDCDETSDETCLEPGEDQDVSCLTETFRDAHNNTLYQRKCVIYKKDTKFECVRHPHYTTVSCVICTTDMCNRAASVSGGKITAGNHTANATSDAGGGGKI